MANAVKTFPNVKFASHFGGKHYLLQTLAHIHTGTQLIQIQWETLKKNLNIYRLKFRKYIAVKRTQHNSNKQTKKICVFNATKNILDCNLDWMFALVFNYFAFY